MADHDRAELMRQFEHALDVVGATGRLDASCLQLPIMSSLPTVKQTLAGYEAGVFNPLQLGVACIVVPTSQGHAPNINKGGTWNFNPVPNPALPDHPSTLYLL